MAAPNQHLIYEVLRQNGLAKAKAAMVALMVVERLDMSNWREAPWGEMINMTEERVEYLMDMSGFPPGTLVYMTDLSNTLAFMFEVWVPAPFGGDIKVVHVGLERNVAAEMPERGEAMRNKVREQLEVMAWEAYAEVGGQCE